MNRVNPLYIVLLLLTIFAISILKLSSAKNELKDAQNSYKTTTTLSNELGSLKSAYSDGNRINRSLKALLNHPGLKASKLHYKFKKSSVTISSEGMSSNSLNMIMSKILNSSYNISLLHVKKLSETKVNFKMEIQW